MATDDRPAAGGQRFRTILDTVATVATVTAAAAVVWSLVIRSPQGAARSPTADSQRSVPVPAEPVAIDGAPVLGDPAAPVAMIVFSDFECPFCGRFARDVFPSIKTNYLETGKVQFVFKHLPIPGLHPRAEPAAAVAVCAAQQGKFWALHDELFKDPTKLDDADLASYEKKVGLDDAQVRSCLNGEAKGRIDEDTALAKTLSIRGTPTFLLGRVQGDGRVKVLQVVAGALSAAEFWARLDAMR
jgi:protein-disulfide isomerase